MVLETIQEEFRAPVEEALQNCLIRFGDRLKSVVLGGSVAFGEAVPGASDVDWFTFLKDEPTSEDIEWWDETRAKLTNDNPAIKEFGSGLFQADRLRQEHYWRFIIRYNSVLLYGSDIVAELEREGVKTLVPSAKMLKSRVLWVEETLKAAVAGNIPEKLFETPKNPAFLARKLARNFVVLEGAYLLMADGHFETFRQKAVIDKLRFHYPEFADLYDITEQLAMNPMQVDISPVNLLHMIAPFIGRLTERVNALPDNIY